MAEQIAAKMNEDTRNKVSPLLQANVVDPHAFSTLQEQEDYLVALSLHEEETTQEDYLLALKFQQEEALNLPKTQVKSPNAKNEKGDFFH